MNLIVFGANGGTGRQVVEQGLAAGHTVTAVVRRPDALASLASAKTKYPIACSKQTTLT